MSNRMISDFAGKPQTQAFFTTITAYVASLGTARMEKKAQVSFSVNRKFLWMWAYEKTADGTLYLTVVLDHAVDDTRFHYVTQVSPKRWNHHVEVKSPEIAGSDWLHALIRSGFEFASA